MFWYGKDSQAGYTVSSEGFEGFIRRKYGGSEKETLITGVMSIIEMTLEDLSDDDYEALGRAALAKRQREEKRCDKCVSRVETNMPRIFDNLWGLCHSSLRQKIKSDLDYKNLGIGDAGGLYKLVQKYCLSSMSPASPQSKLSKHFSSS